MVITFEQKRKRQQILVFALILVIAVTLLVLYFGIFKGAAPPEFPGAEFIERAIPTPEALISGISIKDITINLDIFESPKFEAMEKSLKDYGNLIPVKVEETGRDNPFLPYE